MGAGEGAKIMTREKRLEIYKAMLNEAESDLDTSRNLNCCLFGFCWIARNEIDPELRVKPIDDLVELAKYKPSNTDNHSFWFDTDPNGPDATKRIDILKEIINTMQNGKTQINQNS